MVCPSCHAEIGDGKKFCGKCGAALSVPASVSVSRVPGRCLKCGSEVSPNKKFCGACGGPINARHADSQTGLPKADVPISSPSAAPKQSATSEPPVPAPV